MIASPQNFFDCNNSNVDLETILKSLFVYNSTTGQYGLLVHITKDADCSDWTNAVNCTGTTIEQVLQGAILLDADCGTPALNIVFANTTGCTIS